MAKMSAVVRLSNRGFIVWEADGILARSTLAQAKGGIPAQQVIRQLLTIGLDMARSIRSRVRDHGDLGEGQSFPGYQRGRKVNVSDQYANLAHATPDKWGADPVAVYDKSGAVVRWLKRRQFASSADFHERAGTRPGSYNVTGGMWRGLQVRGLGASSVRIDFAGSSPGTGKGERVPSYSPRSDRGGGWRMSSRTWARPAQVRNGWKGGAIYDRHGVHVLKPTAGEVQHFTNAVGDFLGKTMISVLDSDVQVAKT